MSQTAILSVKSSIFDRKRELVLDKEFLTYDNKDRIGVPPAKIAKQDIADFRFGVRWIKGYSFIIGRIYCVDIKSSSGELIKIRLKSLYGVNRQLLAEKYETIVNTLYNNYFDDVTRQYLKLYADGADFEILGIYFRQDGILMSKKGDLIVWEDIGTRSYATYYALYIKSNPTVYKAFEYLNDWNTGILYSVSRGILQRRNLL